MIITADPLVIVPSHVFNGSFLIPVRVDIVFVDDLRDLIVGQNTRGRCALRSCVSLAIVVVGDGAYLARVGTALERTTWLPT